MKEQNARTIARVERERERESYNLENEKNNFILGEKYNQKSNPQYFTTNRGITIIVLIITIIVMLILLGVGIKVAIDGKLFNTARTAVDSSNNKTALQESRVNELLGELEREEENQIREATAGIRTKKKLPYFSNGKKAIIPAGFTVSGIDSESTIDEGLVIYLIPEDTTIEEWTKDSNNDGIYDVQELYDQFVWIPVDNINDFYMCQSEGTDIDESGTVEENEYKSCDIVLKNNVLTCKTHNSTLLAGRIRDKNKYIGVTPREPDVVTGGTNERFDADETYLTQMSDIIGNTEGYDTTLNFKNQLQTEYNEAVKSIYINKGFWIGRYETADMQNSNKNVNVRILAGKNAGNASWYAAYAQQKMYTINNNLTTVKSGMIQGAVWNEVMAFVHTDTYDTTTIGNVAHNLTKGYKTGGIDYPSDASIPYKDYSKNIYDLEGRLLEVTVGNLYEDRRVTRGGATSDGKSANSYSYSGNPNSPGNYGSRMFLYIL